MKTAIFILALLISPCYAADVSFTFKGAGVAEDAYITSTGGDINYGALEAYYGVYDNYGNRGYTVHRALGYVTVCLLFPGFVLDSLLFICKLRNTDNFDVTESLGVAVVGIDDARGWAEGTNVGSGVNAGEVTWNSDQHGTSTWGTAGALGASDTTGHESNEIIIHDASHPNQGDSLVFYIDTVLANLWRKGAEAGGVRNNGVLMFIKHDWAGQAGPYMYFSDFNDPGYLDSIPYWVAYGHMAAGTATSKLGKVKTGKAEM